MAWSNQSINHSIDLFTAEYLPPMSSRPNGSRNWPHLSVVFRSARPGRETKSVQSSRPTEPPPFPWELSTLPGPGVWRRPTRRDTDRKTAAVPSGIRPCEREDSAPRPICNRFAAEKCCKKYEKMNLRKAKPSNQTINQRDQELQKIILIFSSPARRDVPDHLFEETANHFTVQNFDQVRNNSGNVAQCGALGRLEDFHVAPHEVRQRSEEIGHGVAKLLLPVILVHLRVQHPWLDDKLENVL